METHGVRPDGARGIRLGLSVAGMGVAEAVEDCACAGMAGLHPLPNCPNEMRLLRDA